MEAHKRFKSIRYEHCLTTHNMEEAENLCHKVAIMDKGKIITEGSPNDLIAKFDSDNTEKGNLENVFFISPEET